MSYIALTPSELELARKEPAVFDFELRKRGLDLERHNAFWDALQAVVIVAVPIAAFFGIKGLKGR